MHNDNVMPAQAPKSSTSGLRVEDVILVVLTVVCLPLSWWATTSWWSSLNTPSSASSAINLTVAALCGAVALLVSLVWVATVIGSALLGLGRLTGKKGLTRWGVRLTPAFIRRVLTALLGLNLAVLAPAQAAGPEQFSDAAATVDSSWMPSLPTKDHQTAIATGTTGVNPAVPAAQSSSAQSASSSWSPSPVQPAQPSQPAQPVLPRAERPTQPSHPLGSETYTVVSGDSLWDIAHQELGADASLPAIEQRWRQWWKANEKLLGDDPHYLLPGMVLTRPNWT